jgi:hypothetical protein
MIVRILSARIGRVNAVLENSLDIRTKNMHTFALPCPISCEIRPLRRSASMFPDRRINLVSHFIAPPCSLAIFDEAGRSLSSILGRFKIFWEIFDKPFPETLIAIADHKEHVAQLLHGARNRFLQYHALRNSERQELSIYSIR